MAYQIIDRRIGTRGKSSGNRQRFIRRVKAQVKEAAKDLIREGDIKSIAGGSKNITIPKKDLEEHHISHGEGGEREPVHPGNKEFTPGDRFRRPPKGGGGGSEGSPDGEGEDEFQFELTKDEFLELFFEDLELPDMIKQNIQADETFVLRRAGFVNEGTPARMNIERSMRKARGRRTALRGPKKKKLRELEAQLEEVQNDIKSRRANGDDVVLEEQREAELIEQIDKLKRKIKAVPYVDDMDLQYNHWSKHPVPTTKAVMFCIMDVSGSMGEWEKEMAKRFFMLLYLFLTRAYDTVELVFIRHHSSAKEVDEDEFFYSRESGGTIVSTALELMDNIIKDRYDTQNWNIYACQASDGDNWYTDNTVVEDILTTSILPIVQYYAYVELDAPSMFGAGQSDLEDLYQKLQTIHPNFATTKIQDASEIFQVFRKLFEKGDGNA